MDRGMSTLSYPDPVLGNVRTRPCALVRIRIILIRMDRVVCDGSIHVPLAPAATRELFTPEGERRWAPGWDPAYPGGHRGVFVTHGSATVWMDLGGLRYARVTPGVHAGTVAVRCEPEGGGTRARVSYDLTALGPHADLARFAGGFTDLMAAWQRQIAAAL
jgi:hypothetical protein